MNPNHPGIGNKLYDWTEVSIEGIWIDDHGKDMATKCCTLMMRGKRSQFNALFGEIGQALNANHGVGASINLRGCFTGAPMLDGESVMSAVAEASGHSVTGAMGYVTWGVLLQYPWPGYCCPHIIALTDMRLLFRPSTPRVLSPDQPPTDTIQQSRILGYETNSVFGIAHSRHQHVCTEARQVKPRKFDLYPKECGRT